ncbi:MAG: hypothetical protein ACOYM2_07605 [Rectinemataceae bacterium]
MKFRTIYFLFNGVLVFSFFFVFLMPAFLLGWSYAFEFWKGAWYLAVVFLALIGVLNGFFMVNRKVFKLFETEDWEGLFAHLSELIFIRHRYGQLQVKYLAETAFLLGKVDAISKLEDELRERNPSLLRSMAVVFGFVRVLKGQVPGAITFWAPYLDARGVENRPWLRFGYAFALVLDRRLADARSYLLEGSLARDPIQGLLSAWLLDSLLLPLEEEGSKAEELRLRVREVREGLRRRFPGASLDREIEKAKSEFHIVILSRPISDALTWLRAG